MALPLTRNTTYVQDVTPVKADDLNDIQDAIIATNATVVANTTILIPAEDATAGTPAGGFPELSSAGLGWKTLAGPPDADQPVQYALRVPQGLRLKSWSLAAYKASSAAETLNATLYKRTGIGVGAPALAVVGVSQTNGTNAPGAIALGQAALTEDVAAGEAFILHVNSTNGTAGDYFGDLTIVYGPP